jgi:zinc and cadmium transporter
MLMTWLWAIGSVIAVSLVSFAGITAALLDERRLRGILFILVSLAVGAMFGDAFIHLVPQSFSQPQSATTTSLYILAGIFLFFLLEKFLLWRHEHQPGHVHPVGYMNLAADALHNLLDGILIGISYLVSVEVGLATTLAVLLHEIPQEIGDFGVLLHAGFSRQLALWMNFCSALLAIVGAVAALIAGVYVQKLPAVILPMSAGVFIYIAGSDLVPELHRERELLRSLVQLMVIAAGIGLMFALTLIE